MFMVAKLIVVGLNVHLLNYYWSSRQHLHFEQRKLNYYIDITLHENFL